MKYLRLYADEHGESHWQEMSTTFAQEIYAPPAPAFGLASPVDVERYVMVQFPVGWESPLHPTPRRQVFVMMSGTFEGQTSNGEVVLLQPGDVILMEDTTGLGHAAKVVGDQEVRAMMLHLE